VRCRRRREGAEVRRWGGTQWEEALDIYEETKAAGVATNVHAAVAGARVRGRGRVGHGDRYPLDRAPAGAHLFDAFGVRTLEVESASWGKLAPKLH
jgi:hypothetical protein